ncbi:hypothetical protein ARMA_2214 [Ardenticatena maritima]|uniref:Uncharacterized protein n=1 Tax=Ardenticatena maritima TaxID=872965 RepID=A0A0M8K9T3_9CHLR|nr:hypothetical protein ARMA_2214 [Ardenticatena maritima]
MILGRRADKCTAFCMLWQIPAKVHIVRVFLLHFSHVLLFRL